MNIMRLFGSSKVDPAVDARTKLNRAYHCLERARETERNRGYWRKCSNVRMRARTSIRDQNATGLCTAECSNERPMLLAPWILFSVDSFARGCYMSINSWHLLCTLIKYN